MGDCERNGWSERNGEVRKKMKGLGFKVFDKEREINVLRNAGFIYCIFLYFRLF